ncbi:DUF1343 domain-containing protein [Paenimyroides tangerinum]|uniref:DUF1343 domain-containing protein n=1 Tax=Paenimyroides tangerinum TaxID=2488728 RepID=A0A3P3WD25_9FLAO|nr:DUF1343 domain-containing protein [Paenimyroides tangerinum]RRJ91956.1 DUF1343 domain-containing protein [Paenimyroides tangerinum]
MKYNSLFKNTLLFVGTSLFSVGIWSCNANNIKQSNKLDNTININQQEIKTGADNYQQYLPLLKDKKVGVLTNQSGLVNENNSVIHLVDFLLKNKIDVEKIYAPEHGFRGTADAGELIKDGKDTKTGIPIISLYGKNKKPNKEQLKDIDVMVFDLQDVGTRFYTYISSLHYLMEACAENNIEVIVLDRPNPNGAKVDGPVLEMAYKSFVGMHPIPVLHGMTIGEYAQMINGEKWLENGIQCKLKVIPITNYNKSMPYSLTVKPSPNLPNDQSINLYPSLCFFEGTNVSVGRGTNKQFQVYGSPNMRKTTFSFTPEPNEGAKDPMHNGRKCNGEDLSQIAFVEGIQLKWLLNAYQTSSKKEEFFNSFFTNLAGNKKLQSQIKQGLSEKQIKDTWITGIEDFKNTRKKYLIYKDEN